MLRSLPARGRPPSRPPPQNPGIAKRWRSYRRQPWRRLRRCLPLLVLLASALTWAGPAHAGWSTPPIVVQGIRPNALDPKVVTAGNGDAFTTWYQSNGSIFSVHASRYDAASRRSGAP